MVKKLYTHSGKFHADDVFATAWLRFVFKDEKLPVERVNTITDEMLQEAERGEAIIYDIGEGELDHHQAGSPVRDNGIDFAAFGLCVRKYWNHGMWPWYENFDEILVQPIDESDTTPHRNPLSVAIARFNPEWIEDVSKAPTPPFEVACLIAYTMIVNEMEHQKAIYLAEEASNNALPVTNRVILLEQYAPIYEYHKFGPIDFFVAPSNRKEGEWNIIALKDADGDNKDLIPEQFAADGAVNYPGMVFCHKGRFMATFDSKETAIKFAEEHLR